MKRDRFATFPNLNGFEFVYEAGENISQVYPGKQRKHEHIANSDAINDCVIKTCDDIITLSYIHCYVDYCIATLY